jgi:hypothetical protein
VPTNGNSCSDAGASLGSAPELTQGKMTCMTQVSSSYSSSWKSQLLKPDIILNRETIILNIQHRLYVILYPHCPDVHLIKDTKPFL